jgi:N-sulfoglucosamine sulfohydrolase
MKMSFREVAAGAIAAVTCAVAGFGQAAEPAPAGQPQGTGARPNVLLITVDDMNYDAPGFTGNKLASVTPNIDRLASQSLWFRNGHVAAAICQPSRQALMTGRYPHNNGALGFDPINQSVPTLEEQLHAAGYLNGIMAKVTHLQPQAKYCWDYVKGAKELGEGRDPVLYGKAAAEFMTQAKQEGKPFFLMANSEDPHRPFAGSEQEKQFIASGQFKAPYPSPSRVYKPEEVTVPSFLPDLPEVRREVAEYYSSCHRADESVGAVLQALKDAGQEENTLVMFISDNGMAFPFAKANCYLSSSRTPWLVRWPGHVKPGIDEDHFVCGVDYMPTILETLGLNRPEGMDGRSFLPLLNGQEQDGRQNVFTTINTLSSHKSFPMRCVQDKQFGYIFNAWADGKTVYKNESQTGRTWPAMQAAAGQDSAVAARVDFFSHRSVEELYDLRSDPACLHNLAGQADDRQQLAEMRKQMLQAMEQTHDPHLKDFEQRVLQK